MKYILAGGVKLFCPEQPPIIDDPTRRFSCALLKPACPIYPVFQRQACPVLHADPIYYPDTSGPRQVLLLDPYRFTIKQSIEVARILARINKGTTRGVLESLLLGGQSPILTAHVEAVFNVTVIVAPKNKEAA